MAIRMQCICVDAADPGPLAEWWAELLGWRITHREPDEVVLEPPAGSVEDGVAPDLLFLRVPDAKQTKNRIHFDLRPDDHVDYGPFNLESPDAKELLQLGSPPYDILLN